MLLQSHNNVVQILPALPPSWKSGYVKGLRARGGFEMDIQWENNLLKEVKITSLLGNSCKIMYGAKSAEFRLKRGEQLILNSELTIQ
jgi:alpha-L-fucosidase 2